MNTNTAPSFEKNTNSHSQQSESSLEFNFFDLLAIFQRQWGLIFFGILFFGIMGSLYYFKTDKLYRSEAIINILERNPAIASVNMLPGAGGGMFNALQDSMLSTHVSFLTSDEVLAKTIEALEMKRGEEYNFYHEQGDKLKYIEKNLEIKKGGEGKLKNAMTLTIQFTSPSAQMSQFTLEQILEAYQDQVDSQYADPRGELVRKLEQQQGQYRQDIMALNAEVSQIEKESKFVMNLDGVHVRQQNLAQYQAEQAKLKVDSKIFQSRLELYRETLNGRTINDLSDDEVLGILMIGDTSEDEKFKTICDLSQGGLMKNSPYYDAMMSQRAESLRAQFQKKLEAEAEIAMLTELYPAESEHSEMKKARGKLRGIERFLQDNEFDPTGMLNDDRIISSRDILKNFIKHWEMKLAELDKRQKELNQMIVEEEKILKEYNDWNSSLEFKRAETTSKRELIQDIEKKLADMRDIGQEFGVKVLTLRAPKIPEKPFWPSLFIIAGLSVVGGTFFGAALAYLVDLCDRTFRSPFDVKQAAGVQILAQIPRIHTINRRKKWHRASKSPGVIAEEIVVHHKPKSTDAEVFRGLRTSLLSGSKLKPKSILQVTSTNANDGKSTVSTNLSIAIANSRRKTLLVDCDLRSPNLHSIFGIANGIGLSNFLNGEKTFHEVITSTQVENLILITAGTNRMNPSELLTSKKYKEFLRLAREEFDVVILDTPPILAVSDATIIASESDALLLVARITKNGKPQLMHACHLLREVQSNILGVVINTFKHHKYYNPSKETEGYGYGYSYGYHNYGYGEGYGESERDETPPPIHTHAPLMHKK